LVFLKGIYLDLFAGLVETPINVIQRDGLVLYYGELFDGVTADNYFQQLMHGIDWKNDQAVIYGKTITTKRKIAWYGEREFTYTYSKTTKKAKPWTPQLLTIKQSVENITNETFNACLLNLYHDGSEGMAWHSDAEKDLKRNGAVASVSLGAQRKFSFKHKQDKELVSLVLSHGSLLVMKGTTQTHWLHRLPPTTKISSPRINLTFRTIVGQ
jgi:alkylated DNA repair dioxygenase AlkB